MTEKENANIMLRHAVQDDLEALTRIYNHYVRHSIATFDTMPFATQARQSWFSHHAVGSPHQIWVADQRGAVLGYASSSQFRPKAAYDSSVETSIYLHPDHQGRGIGQLLYEQLFEGLSSFRLHRAYAGIALPNPASISLHSRFGFSEIGIFSQAGHKFGGYHDVHWFQKSLEISGT